MRLDELHALRGKAFPGGVGRIEAYENLLMHDAVHSVRSQAPHPVWAFLAAQRGMGMTLDEVFSWFACRAEHGPLLGECTFEFRKPLRTACDYRVNGHIVRTERKTGRSLGVFDLVTFVLELESRAAEPDVSVGYTFVLPRRDQPDTVDEVAAPANPASGNGGPVRPGKPLPPWELAEVGEQEMKLLALLLRDPNPIHIDGAAAAALGLGERPVNQGPANLAYVITMLTAAEPDRPLRRLRARFLDQVLAGDRVTAGGEITGEHGGELHCSVWLQRGDGRRVVAGEAVLGAASGGCGADSCW